MTRRDETTREADVDAKLERRIERIATPHHNSPASRFLFAFKLARSALSASLSGCALSASFTASIASSRFAHSSNSVAYVTLRASDS